MLESNDFLKLLTEAGIEFSPLPDFTPCPVNENSAFLYQYAERSPSGGLEVRYRIDPLVRMDVERKAALGDVEMLSSLSLNQLHVTNFMAIIYNLSGDLFVEPTVLKPESTALLYSADWSAICFMRIANKDFSTDYDSGYVLAIHKNEVADVYVIGLYNDNNGTTGRFDKNNLPADVKSTIAPTLRFI